MSARISWHIRADPARPGRWTVELVRLYGQHAANSVPAQRDRLWQTAHETAEQFVAASREQPTAILVRVQDALNRLAEGELARLEAESRRNPMRRSSALGLPFAWPPARWKNWIRT